MSAIRILATLSTLVFSAAHARENLSPDRCGTEVPNKLTTAGMEIVFIPLIQKPDYSNEVGYKTKTPTAALQTVGVLDSLIAESN